MKIKLSNKQKIKILRGLMRNRAFEWRESVKRGGRNCFDSYLYLRLACAYRNSAKVIEQ
jgi:hypothetical protein